LTDADKKEWETISATPFFYFITLAFDQRAAAEKARKAKERAEALERQKAETARRISYINKFGAV
jgi:hypothetical protein